MQCPKCGAMVLKGDVTCKKCGALLMEAAEAFNPEDICRSRAMLLYKAWIGGGNGAHLKWLGYDEEAAAIAEQFGLGKQVGTFFKAIINPAEWFTILGYVIYECALCIGIIFGKYPTDAQGHPVRWITKKKK